MTIFEKIIARQIPAEIIWEDDDVVAFHDVNPQAPVHALIVPKRAVPRLADATESDRALLGKLLLVARDLAKKLDLSSGYRVVINSGPDAGERVPPLPVALLGTRPHSYPNGSGREPPREKSTLLTNKRPVDSNDALLRKAFQRFWKQEIGCAFSFFETCESEICPTLAPLNRHHSVVLDLRLQVSVGGRFLPKRVNLRFATFFNYL